MRITLLLSVALVAAWAPAALAGLCGEEVCVHHFLESQKDVPGKVRTKFIAAAHITRITLEASEAHTCGDNYGNDNNNDDKEPVFGIEEKPEENYPQVYVKNGCTGNFKICYILGVCEKFTLSYRKPNITLHNSCAITSMHCSMQHTDYNCSMDNSFTFYNNFAKVIGGTPENPGCDCEFWICHAPKDITSGGADLPEPTKYSISKNVNVKNETADQKDLTQYNFDHVKRQDEVKTDENGNLPV